MIKVRFFGQIISGSQEYGFVGIQENTNGQSKLTGLNVLMSTSPSFELSYDDWVEDYSGLIEYLKEKSWVIKWLPIEG